VVIAALLMDSIALAVVTSVAVPGRDVATNIMTAIQGSRVARMIVSTAKDMNALSEECY
jgi:hypothetical protein